jgi:hypothetical protein
MVDRRDADGDTLRVQASKLDTVLTRSGELLLAVRQAERRRDEWTTVEDGASGLAENFRLLQGLLARDTDTETRAAAQQVGVGIDKLKDDLERVLAAAASGGRGLVRTAGDLDAGVRSLADGPVRRSGEGLERTVRDLALAAGKEVVFKLVGHEVELDRAVAERLKDPLLHLVRNAVDHGIESPAGARGRRASLRRGSSGLRRPARARRSRSRSPTMGAASTGRGYARKRAPGDCPSFRGRSRSPGPRLPPRPLHRAGRSPPSPAAASASTWSRAR